MLDEAGGIVAEFSITRLDDGAFLLIGASAAEQIHLRWMQRHLGDGVTLRPVTAEMGALAVQGPGARDLLSALTGADLSTAAFPWMGARRIAVAGVDCLALRVSFVGELGWELYCAPHDLPTLWDAVARAGAVPFGARALDWLRLEKGFARYGSEITAEVTPHEIGMGFTVDPDKPAFRGRDAVATAPLRWHLRQLRVAEGGAMDPVGQETVLADDGAVAGYVTSGGFGATVGMPLAMALLLPGFEDGARGLNLDIQGRMVPAEVLDRAPHDPGGLRMRA
jgi:glycine cleavage system aminomethyltransferase T